MSRKQAGIVLSPELLRLIAGIPTQVLVKHVGMSEAEAIEFRLAVALAALRPPADPLTVVRAAMAGPPVEPPPATVVDTSTASADERLAAARARRPNVASTGGYVIEVNGRYATGANALDARTLTPLLREAATFPTASEALEAIAAWKGAPDGARAVPVP